MSRIPTTTTQKQQRGVVLVVSLMVLLVLTLLGISSLDSSIMEEKMAANAQTASITFQEAESAIRQTYFAENLFNEDGRRAAVRKAHDGSASERQRNHSAGSITSSTELVYRSEGRSYNSSDDFVAHHFEIISTASVDGINSSITQGYSVSPLQSYEKN